MQILFFLNSTNMLCTLGELLEGVFWFFFYVGKKRKMKKKCFGFDLWETYK